MLDDGLDRAVPVARTVTIEDGPPSVVLRTAAEAWCATGTEPDAVGDVAIPARDGYNWTLHRDFVLSNGTSSNLLE